MPTCSGSNVLQNYKVVAAYTLHALHGRIDHDRLSPDRTALTAIYSAVGRPPPDAVEGTVHVTSIHARIVKDDVQSLACLRCHEMRGTAAANGDYVAFVMYLLMPRPRAWCRGNAQNSHYCRSHIACM